MKPLKITVEKSLFNILDAWVKQAGFPKDKDDEKERAYLSIKYWQAIEAIGNLFIKHHKDLNDEEFVRGFRFLSDAGLLEELDSEKSELDIKSVIDRFDKFKYREPEEKND